MNRRAGCRNRLSTFPNAVRSSVRNLSALTFALLFTIERIGTSEKVFSAGNLVQAASLPERSAIARRGDPAHAAKLAIKVGQIRETNFKSDHAYGKIGLRETHTCASDA